MDEDREILQGYFRSSISQCKPVRKKLIGKYQRHFCTVLRPLFRPCFDYILPKKLMGRDRVYQRLAACSFSYNSLALSKGVIESHSFLFYSFRCSHVQSILSFKVDFKKRTYGQITKFEGPLPHAISSILYVRHLRIKNHRKSQAVCGTSRRKQLK